MDENSSDNDSDSQNFNDDEEPAEDLNDGYDYDEREQNAGNSDPIHHNSISPWNKENGGVTTLYKCDATDAKALYIFDSAHKLQQSGQYDIGGVYTESGACLWFFYTTSAGPGRIYLMNIFICQRQPSTFSLGISDSNILTTTMVNKEKVKTLNSELYWQNFHSTQPNEVKYIKTFQFTEEDRISMLKLVLVIPISINLSPKSMLMKNVVQKVKAQLDFGEELLKDQKHDFTLMSSEGKEFSVHRIVLAAHSPKLRDLIRAEDSKTLSLDISNNEVELLLQYLYTGVIKDILNQQLEGLLMLADKFQLNNLTQLVYHAMKLSINSENAISMAVVAEKYNYSDVQESAFSYIAQHPELLDSEAFSAIDNANVVKKLLRYIHAKGSPK